jgi:hypothetical protein
LATTPDNPATALHGILRTVVTTPQGDVNSVWTNILGAPVGSVDFTQRHSEVVGLFRQVYELLLGLPEGDTEREQYLSYMPHYYKVIVYPGSWTDEASSIGAVNVVDHLTGIASTFRYRALTTPQVSEDAVTRLRASITEWNSLLGEADLDEKLANEIRGQVRHIEWLLDNTTLLGMQPVVRATKTLAGSGISAIATSGYKKWWPKILRATAGCLAFIALANADVHDVNALLAGVSEIPQHILEVGKAWTLDEPHALPAGDDAAPTDNSPDVIVDGEIVEDDETHP